jgi:hypothetical protein
LPAPVPPGTPVALVDEAARLAEVRAFALASFEVDQLVVFERTLEAPLNAEALAFLRTAMPELDGSMLEEFSKAKSRPVAPEEFGRPVRVLTEKEQTALFKRRDAGPDGWARYRLQFPKASGIIHLSEVALSRDAAPKRQRLPAKKLGQDPMRLAQRFHRCALVPLMRLR